MKRNQSGFTLVEIAIVLVIIGLLLGGVMKGQELIDSTRAKSVYNDMRGIQTAINSYVDRYRGIPGDSSVNTQTTYGWANNYGASGASANDGLITVPVANTFTTPATGEGAGFWQSLRTANFVTGDPTSAALPTIATGGLLGVTNGAFGMVGNAVCAAGLTPKIAGMIDRQYDDGSPATGLIRGVSGAASPVAVTAAATAATTYPENAAVVWTLCMKM